MAQYGIRSFYNSSSRLGIVNLGVYHTSVGKGRDDARCGSVNADDRDKIPRAKHIALRGFAQFSTQPCYDTFCIVYDAFKLTKTK